MSENLSRPTLEDIAQEINISRTTIYKVINNKGAVREKTRRLIQEALEKYNYVSNKNARNLAMNRRHAMAFVSFASPSADYFAGTVQRGIRQALQEYGDHGLAITTSVAPTNKPERQLDDIREAYDAGLRHFAIASANPAVMADSVRWLKDRDCRVVLISKDVSGVTRDAFIGIDEYQCGRLAAELMAKMLTPGAAVQALRASDSSASTRKRFKGFCEELQRHPGITLLLPPPTVSSKAGIVRAVRGLVEEPAVKGIMDLTYRLDCVAGEIAAAGRGDLKLIGVDLSPGAVPFLRDGTVDAVIYQNIQHQAFLACKVLFEEMCYGNPVVPQKPVKLEIVMKHNLEFFIDTATT
ncbi:MAG: substrate-binding domain-containing protein [Planctomycetaceae bacterium]|nr:substrate-binding domain-containing protein [Planctomycetaceae bacterium]